MSKSKNTAVGLLERIKSYYGNHGHKMNGTAEILKKQYKRVQMSEAIKCQNLSEGSIKNISKFISDFISHYLQGGKAKQLAQELQSNEEHIEAFLQSLQPVQVHQPAVQVQHLAIQQRGRQGSTPQGRQELGAGYVNHQPQKDYSRQQRPEDPHAYKQRHDGRDSQRYEDPEKEQLKREHSRLMRELDHYKQQRGDRDSQSVSDLVAHQKREVGLLQQHLREKDEKLLKYEQQISDLSHRLSNEMNKKISADESSLENISVKNRPMNISGEYLQVFTNEWTEVKNVLDKVWKEADEQTRLQYLCDIVLEAYGRCVHIKENCNVYIQESNEKWNQKITNGEATGMQVKQVVFDYWKARGSKFEVAQHILEDVIKKVSQKKKPPTSLIKQPTLQIYVKAVFHLTWSMVIQKPPMTLNVDGIEQKWRGEKLQEPAWGSKNPDKGIVQCYVYPSLLHGEQLMVRGKVLIL